jgi:hypothetical protein
MKAQTIFSFPETDAPNQSRLASQAPHVAYVEHYTDVFNPFGLKELSHKKICQVYCVLVMGGEIIEKLALEGTCVLDERTLNN